MAGKSEFSHWSVISFCLGTLFLLQGARELVGSTYNLNLATMSINGSIVAVLAFFSPLLLFFGRSCNSRLRILLFALLMGAARIAMSLDPPVYLYLGSSALLVVFSGLFLPPFFSGKEAASDPSQDETTLSGGAGGRRLMFALALALGLDIMFRTLGNTFDITTYGLWGRRWQSIVFVLPLVMLFLYSVLKSPALGMGGKTEKYSSLLGAGLGALAFLYFLILGFPSNMVRWTGGSYPVSAVLSVVLLCLYVMSLFIPGWGSRLRTGPGAVALSTLFFSALLVMFIYPRPLVMTVLLPLVLFCSAFLGERLLARVYGGNARSVAAFFSWAALVFVLLTVTSVMCLTWAHVPGMSVLRDKIGSLVVIAALVSVTSVLSIKGWPLAGGLDGKRAGALLCLVLIVGTTAGSFYYAASPGEGEFSGELRVMTYNIHQGYGMDGKIAPWDILAPVKDVGPDVLLLQECDTNRPSSTNVDIVGWLARELEMHAYFGPDTGEQIYGVAILSRYPIYDTEIYYLDSEEDQRVLLRGEIRPDGRSLAVYAVHMGLSPRDRTVQTKEILGILEKEPLPHLLGGDFNSLPNGSQMENFTSEMGDTWALAGKDPMSEDAYTFDSPDPYERIDYILVSRDLAAGVERTGVIRGIRASDHLPVWTRLRLQ